MSESQRDLGIKAFHAGNRVLAFQHLTKAIKENPQDDLAWLWLAACVDSDDKKRFCLQKVLAINPSNPSAKSELRKMESGVSQPSNIPISRSTTAAENKVIENSYKQEQNIRNSRIPRSNQDADLSLKQKNLKKEYRKFTISLIGFSILLIFATLGIFYILQPGIFKPHTTSLSVPEWINQNPTSDEVSRLTALSENFENPLKQKYLKINSAIDLQLPEKTPVSITGKLKEGFQVNTIDTSSTPVYGLEIEINGKLVLVLQRGYIGDLAPGDNIKIDGIYLPQVNGISAHKLLHESILTGFPDTPNLALVRWGELDVIWILFSVTIHLWFSSTRSWRRAFQKISAIVISAAIILSLSACTVAFTTTIDSNGKGHITVTATDSKENMDFMRKVPGMNGYLETLGRQLQSDGLQVTKWEDGNTESFFLQRAFASPEELERKEGINDAEGSWVAIQEYEENGWKIIRYLALVDTTTLFRDTPGIDSQVAYEVQNQMSQIDMTYSLVLPGQITYHNASEENGTKVTWKIGMNKKNPVVGESRIPLSEPLDGNIKKIILLGFWAIFFIFGILPLNALLKSRKEGGYEK